VTHSYDVVINIKLQDRTIQKCDMHRVRKNTEPESDNDINNRGKHGVRRGDCHCDAVYNTVHHSVTI